MERLWEWEKINAKNDMVKEGYSSFVIGGGSFGSKEQYVNLNRLKVVNIAE